MLHYFSFYFILIFNFRCDDSETKWSSSSTMTQPFFFFFLFSLFWFSLPVSGVISLTAADGLKKTNSHSKKLCDTSLPRLCFCIHVFVAPLNIIVFASSATLSFYLSFYFFRRRNESTSVVRQSVPSKTTLTPRPAPLPTTVTATTNLLLIHQLIKRLPSLPCYC